MRQGIFAQNWLPEGFGANVPEATSARQVTMPMAPLARLAQVLTGGAIRTWGAMRPCMGSPRSMHADEFDRAMVACGSSWRPVLSEMLAQAYAIYRPEDLPYGLHLPGGAVIPAGTEITEWYTDATGWQVGYWLAPRDGYPFVESEKVLSQNKVWARFRPVEQNFRRPGAQNFRRPASRVSRLALAVRAISGLGALGADPDAYVCGQGTRSGFPPNACGERFCSDRGMLPGEVAPNIAVLDEWCADGTYAPVFIYGAGLRGGRHYGGGGGGHRGGGGGGHRGGGGGGHRGGGGGGHGGGGGGGHHGGGGHGGGGGRH